MSIAGAINAFTTTVVRPQVLIEVDAVVLMLSRQVAATTFGFFKTKLLSSMLHEFSPARRSPAAMTEATGQQNIDQGRQHDSVWLSHLFMSGGGVVGTLKCKVEA